VAEVFLTGEMRKLAGGVESLQVAAANVQELIARLDQRFPGLAEQIAAGTAVAIDGEVFPDANFEPLEPDSEVHFLPAVRGG
jgi:molybdopterin converting factor small subunit